MNTPNDYIHVLAFRNRWVSISPRPSVPQPVNLKRQRAPERTTSLVKTTTARVCASASASNTRERHDLYPNLHTFYTCYLLCCAPRPLSCLVRTRPPSLGVRSGMEQWPQHHLPLSCPALDPLGTVGYGAVAAASTFYLYPNDSTHTRTHRTPRPIGRPVNTDRCVRTEQPTTAPN